VAIVDLAVLIDSLDLVSGLPTELKQSVVGMSILLLGVPMLPA
jgi:hypothetical protein